SRAGTAGPRRPSCGRSSRRSTTRTGSSSRAPATRLTSSSPSASSGSSRRSCQRTTADAGPVSRRDLVHLLTALADAAHAQADVGVPVAVLDEAIGRGRRDMRTPLNLQSLEGDGLVRQLADGTWALTEAGVRWLREDQEL